MSYYRRRRSRRNPAHHLTGEQLEQRRKAIQLKRRSDVLAMGVSKYIEMDTLTSDEMQDLGEILLDASKMADDADNVLDSLMQIEDVEEAETHSLAPN